jgi:DNA (cytosine-5)-methyltransferase 1
VAELGYGFAYRVLDAQYFGVAQRRRRVFVVGYFGDWRPAAEVLFEPESLCRDNPPSRSKGKEVASVTGGGIVGALCARDSKTVGSQFVNEGKVFAQPYEIGNTLTARMAKGMNSDCNEGQTPVLEPIPIDMRNAGRDLEKHDEMNRQGVGVGNEGDPAHTVTSAFVNAVAQPIAFAQNQRDEVRIMQVAGALAAEPGMKQQTYLAQPIALAENTIGRKPENGGNATEPMHDIAPCLTKADQHGVAYGFEPGITKREGDPNRFVEDATPTLRANMGDNQTAMASQMAVRRLTPVECERLQGFPDNYTDIKPKGKETPDGPRYKALGNSMAVPVMAWIGKRIAEYQVCH